MTFGDVGFPVYGWFTEGFDTPSNLAAVMGKNPQVALTFELGHYPTGYIDSRGK
jgi:hypothetical protein